MAVYASENTAVKKVKDIAIVGNRIQLKKSELKRYNLYLSNKEYKGNTAFMKVRFWDDSCTDIIVWLGFDKDSKIFSIFRADKGSALSYIKNYFKTLLEVYKDRSLRIIDIDIANKTDIDVLYNDIKALRSSERIIWDFCPSVIIWEVMTDDFYKDRATQFFMLGNYANDEVCWPIFEEPDAWSRSYYDSWFNNKCHDYTFAGQRFKINNGILYFKENIPVIKYKSSKDNIVEQYYKTKYHTELFAVKLIDFQFLGKIKEYAVMDKNAPYIPEEYYRTEVKQ